MGMVSMFLQILLTMEQRNCQKFKATAASNQCVSQNKWQQPGCSVFSPSEHSLINVGTLSLREVRFAEGKAGARHNAAI